MWAGFKRSTETVVERPLTLIKKYLAERFRTSYGPSYGACRGLRTASCHKNTLLAVIRSAGMYTWLGEGNLVGMGLRRRMASFKRCTKTGLVDSGTEQEVVKKSAGNVSEVP